MKFNCQFLLGILFAACSFSVNAYSIRISSDTADAHHASGVAFVANDSDEIYFGLSASRVRSNLALESANRNEIYPVYAFSGLAFSTPISPFVELGIDLGDALLDKMFEGDGQDVDIYFSFGLALTIKKSIRLSVYHKTYNLYFNEINDPALQNVNLDMVGASLSFYIN